MENNLLYVCDTQEIQNLSRGLSKSNFPYDQFILCTSGKGILCSESTLETEISVNTLIFIKENAFFSLRNITKDFSIKLIAFRGSITPMYTQYFDFGSVIDFNGKSESIKYFNKIYDMCVENPDLKNSTETEVFLYSLIGLCGENILLSKQQIKTSAEMLVDACNNYIRQHIDNINLDCSQLSELFQATTQSLNSIYKISYGMNCDEYIYHFRMEFSKTLIIQQYDNYWNDCGYDDKHKFYEDFKNYCGKTPSDYLRILCTDVR